MLPHEHFDTFGPAADGADDVAADLAGAFDDAAHGAKSRVRDRRPDLSDRADGPAGYRRNGLDPGAGDFTRALQDIDHLVFDTARDGVQNVINTFDSGRYGVGRLSNNLC